MILFRLLGTTIGLLLLLWAYQILSNIWQYNDSGTVTYLVFAGLPGFPGLLLLSWSLRSTRPAGRRCAPRA